ncbi:hypothetical protein [Nocardia sp. XZ_19_369]|uniref:hypothetical protein n=1 Tax=Nocardia sp. XZ_19_369 TaxID=2769487 RepID=UPI0018904470|nr:hypothetical protein [Nocardia sp. XZ_19_369]
MSNLINAAREGQLAVEMKPEDFVCIDRDCDYFKRTIQRIQTAGASGHSGRSIRTEGQKAKDRNDVCAVREQHYKMVDGLQSFYRSVRDE